MGCGAPKIQVDPTEQQSKETNIIQPVQQPTNIQNTTIDQVENAQQILTEQQRIPEPDPVQSQVLKKSQLVPKPIAERIAPVNPDIDIEVENKMTTSVNGVKPLEKSQPTQQKRRVAKPILKAKEIDAIQLKLPLMDKVEKELDKELVGKALQRCGSAKKEKKLDFD